MTCGTACVKWVFFFLFLVALLATPAWLAFGVGFLLLLVSWAICGSVHKERGRHRNNGFLPELQDNDAFPVLLQAEMATSHVVVRHMAIVAKLFWLLFIVLLTIVWFHEHNDDVWTYLALVCCGMGLVLWIDSLHVFDDTTGHVWLPPLGLLLILVGHVMGILVSMHRDRAHALACHVLGLVIFLPLSVQWLWFWHFYGATWRERRRCI